jgi:two-component system, response regulator
MVFPPIKMDELKSSFGDAIKRTRSERRISQQELADRAGLHRTFVSDVERGICNLSLGNIEKLAGALEISVAKLFALERDDPAPDPFVEILLVEDIPSDAELTVRAFRKAKITNVVHVVRDGAEALEFLFATCVHEHRKNQPLPGLILLDLNLPKIDGLEVLRQIKADKRTQQIPLIVLTVSNHERDIAACRRLGVENYIVKPVGFQNFSEITPHLGMEWMLEKPARSNTGKRTE